MKKLVCAMLLILSVCYALDEEQLTIECRDFKDAQSCKKLFFYTKSLCDKGDDRGCFNMGVIYSTDKYGVVENKAKALEYYKPLCDKGYDEAKTCNVVGAIYGVFGSSGKSDMYYKKACNAGNESSCEYLRKMEQIKGLYPY